MDIVDNYFNKYACNNVDLDFILIQRITNNIENKIDDTTNKTEECVNKTEECVNKTEECVNKTEECVNKTEECVNKTEEYVNKTEECINKTDENIDKPSELINILKINKLLNYNNNNLLSENIRLKNENNELLQLLNNVIKTDPDNKDYYKIKVKIISKINRDLRTKCLFPFNNLLSL
jgi:hypothetical protein